MTSIYDRYFIVVSSIKDIEENRVIPFTRELVRRHSSGWTIPMSTYNRCKDLLFYKESLERHSPYYVDLLKIADIKNLRSVLTDLYHTIKIKYSSL